MKRGRAAAVLSATLFLGCGGDVPDPGPDRIYLASGGTDEIYVLDGTDGSVLDTVSTNPRPHDVDEPHAVAVEPDGSHWYATLSHGEPTLWKFDASDARRVGVLPLGSLGAARIGIAPDGERAFIPEYWRGGPEASGLTVVRLDDLTILGRSSVCDAPHDARPSPSRPRVAVTCSLGDEIVLLDAETLAVVSRVPAGPDPGPPGSPRYTPANAAWTPDGERLLVTLRASGEVLVLDAGGAVLDRVAVGASPLQIEVAPDGRRAVVALRDEQAAAVLELGEEIEVRKVGLPDARHPHGIALSSDGERAFVSFEGSVGAAGGVVAVDLPGGEILWRREIGIYILGVAAAPSSRNRPRPRRAPAPGRPS